MKKKFSARLGGEEGGDIPLLEIPFDVKASFGKARPPVVVTVNGFSFRSTVSVYGGKSYVGLRRDYREAAKVHLGDLLDVTLESDDAPREVAVPADFAAALKKKKGMLERWEKLSFSHRKEHVQAIEEAKKPETRVRRIANALKILESKR
jgi:hypothetical protein